MYDIYHVPWLCDTWNSVQTTSSMTTREYNISGHYIMVRCYFLRILVRSFVLSVRIRTINRSLTAVRIAAFQGRYAINSHPSLNYPCTLRRDESNISRLSTLIGDRKGREVDSVGWWGWGRGRNCSGDRVMPGLNRNYPTIILR